MTFISGKRVDRRTMLRGIGATVALPFFDAMIPARGLWSRSARAAALARTRLVCIEMVHGAAGASDWGRSQSLWSPVNTGRDFDLTPSALRPLEAFRKYVTIVSDTDVRNAEAHVLDAGHFALDTAADGITVLVRAFLQHEGVRREY